MTIPSVFGRNPLLWLWCVSFLFIWKKYFTKKCFTYINFSMNNIWYSWYLFDCFDYGTAVVIMCLTDLLLRGESQLLHFETYCSVCAEATYSIGCSLSMAECLGDRGLTWSEIHVTNFGSRTPCWLCWTFLRQRGSIGLFHTSFFLCPSLNVRLAWQSPSLS